MAYQKGVILYANALRQAGPNSTTEWAWLPKYDHMLIGEGAYADPSNGIAGHTPDAVGHLTTAQLAHIGQTCLKYFNHWWRDGYTGGIWFHGPGDVESGSQADVLIDSKHTFRMSDRHMDRLLGWCEAAMLDETYPCGGVFMDDFGYGVSSVTSGDPYPVWGAMNGRLGYPAADWNTARVVLFQNRLKALAATLGKYVLFNGCDEINGTGPAKGAGLVRMWEGYMRRYTRAELQAGCNPGDWIVVAARDLSANDTLSWYEVQAGDEELDEGAEIGDSYAPGGTNSIMDQAIEDANNLGLVVAVTFNQNSARGTYTYNGVLFGSGAALIDDPDSWEA